MKLDQENRNPVKLIDGYDPKTITQRPEVETHKCCVLPFSAQAEQQLRLALTAPLERRKGNTKHLLVSTFDFLYTCAMYSELASNTMDKTNHNISAFIMLIFTYVCLFVSCIVSCKL